MFITCRYILAAWDQMTYIYSVRAMVVMYSVMRRSGEEL